MAKATTKKRKVIVESTGEAHISATFNNIIISLTNKKGEVISWSSAGKMGFRGSKEHSLRSSNGSRRLQQSSVRSRT
jgi:small subunit ribosomal protein S11